MQINKLRSCIRNDRYEISLHAQEERFVEDISILDIEEAILKGDLLEDYPDDPRGPSCLILGYSGKKPIHIVCSILPNRWARIITVYTPRMPKWINPRQRRK